MIFEQLIKECEIKAVRSSGSGGQHVNKVATKIELQFNINTSLELKEDEKNLLLETLKPRLTNQGVLILQCGETRSQLKNKEIIIMGITIGVIGYAVGNYLGVFIAYLLRTI